MATDRKPRDDNGRQRDRVVYLIGAGASHACVKWVNSPYGILMGDLGQPLSDEVHDLVDSCYEGDSSLTDLVNAVIDEHTDFEHVITFLDDSPSLLHRKFAGDLRSAFERVLRDRLEDIRENNGENPIELYTALLDMYNIPECPEELAGILTTNYDEYIEEAIDKADQGPVDFGFKFGEVEKSTKQGVRLLKLHGSFGWQDTWPTSRKNGGHGDETLWIPPGIQKAKQRYPFSVVWGLARELLTCDILRIVGCRLDGNDWDLISLLFTTRHVNSQYRPYTVEVIDSPTRAKDLKVQFPYLDVLSILEVEEIGAHLMSELSTGAPRRFDELTKYEQRDVINGVGEQGNWFEMWLRTKAELLYSDLTSVDTPLGWFQRFLERAHDG